MVAAEETNRQLIGVLMDVFIFKKLTVSASNGINAVFVLHFYFHANERWFRLWTETVTLNSSLDSALEPAVSRTTSSRQ